MKCVCGYNDEKEKLKFYRAYDKIALSDDIPDDMKSIFVCPKCGTLKV